MANNGKVVQTNSAESACIGTKIGKCDICKVRKKILLLRYGFSLCEECLGVCTLILEQLEQNEEKLEASAKKHRIYQTQSET